VYRLLLKALKALCSKGLAVFWGIVQLIKVKREIGKNISSKKGYSKAEAT